MINTDCTATRIKAARERKHLTQEELAEQIGVSTQQMSFLEQGRSGLSLKALVNLCDRLDVSADHLLCRDTQEERGAFPGAPSWGRAILEEVQGLRSLLGTQRMPPRRTRRPSAAVLRAEENVERGSGSPGTVADAAKPPARPRKRKIV